MYKVKRNPQKFEPLDLFSTLVEDLGYTINQEGVVEKVSEIFSQSVNQSKKNGIMLHGARVEGLFSYVVRGMKSVKFIKKEDAGDVYASTDKKLQIPDFRIILNDDTLIFVEVKNHNKDDKFSLDIEYVESLDRYSNLNKGVLFIAVYYRSIFRWVLLPISRFSKNGDKYEISLEDAMYYSEFSSLGDKCFGLYKSIEIKFKLDENNIKEKFKDDFFNYEGKIKKIDFKCGDKVINDDTGRKILFAFARYGSWPSTYECSFNNNELVEIKITYEPEDKFFDPEIKVGFRGIAQYSVILTNSFTLKTVKDEEIIRLLYSGETFDVTTLVPSEYKSPDLAIVEFKPVPPN